MRKKRSPPNWPRSKGEGGQRQLRPSGAGFLAHRLQDKDRALVEQFADRVGEIDARAFTARRIKAGLYIFFRKGEGGIHVEPVIKMDYASYLRASPLARAAMHASGAVVTKIVPLVLTVLAVETKVPMAPAIALAAMTLLYILTDIFYSTRLGDWGYVLRELRSATR